MPGCTSKFPSGTGKKRWIAFHLIHHSSFSIHNFLRRVGAGNNADLFGLVTKSGTRFCPVFEQERKPRFTHSTNPSRSNIREQAVNNQSIFQIILRGKVVKPCPLFNSWAIFVPTWLGNFSAIIRSAKMISVAFFHNSTPRLSKFFTRAGWFG